MEANIAVVRTLLQELPNRQIPDRVYEVRRQFRQWN
jgi:hypothetical protein